MGATLEELVGAFTVAGVGLDPAASEGIVAALHSGLIAPDALLAIVADAQAAKALFDQGRREEGLALLTPHREAAVAAGLGELYDAMMASI